MRSRGGLDPGGVALEGKPGAECLLHCLRFLLHAVSRDVEAVKEVCSP